MSNEVFKQIQNSNSFDAIEDGQICYEGNHIIYKDGVNRIDLMDTYDQETIEETFLKLGSIPIDRFGDNSYLPLDIKGDFKGPVTPDNSKSIIVRENDGTLAGLRGGYNGAYQHVFYFYSNTGIFDVNNITITDQIYSPDFLITEASNHEIVSRIISSNQHGFLVHITNLHIANYNRYYWININSTMDSKFHSYVDVTDTISTYNIASLVYIPEKDMFVGCRANNVQIVFFNNNLPINWAYIPLGTTNTTLSTKSMNTVNELTGVVENKTYFFDSTNTSSYITVLSNNNGNSATSILLPAGGTIIPQFVYQEEANNIYGYVRYSCRVVFSDGQSQNFSIIYRINISSSNIVSYYTEPDDQTFPFVYDIKVSPNTNNSGTPTELKANKYPIVFGYDYFFNESVIPDGYDIYGFSQMAYQNTQTIFYSVDVGNNLYTKHPYIFNNVPSKNHYVTSFNVIPTDPSLLGKNLIDFSFIGYNTAQVVSRSKLFGETVLTDKLITASIPVDTNRTLDFGATNAIGLPSSITQYTNMDQYRTNSGCISTLYDKQTSKYRNIPYRFLINNTINDMIVYVCDENRNIDNSMYNNGILCKFPNNANIQLQGIIDSILQSTNIPTPENKSATVTFINANGINAYLLITFSATVYGVDLYHGFAVCRANIDVNRNIDMDNIQLLSTPYLNRVQNAQSNANSHSATGSHGIYYGDDRIYINISGSGYSTVGGNSYPNYALHMDYNGNVVEYRHYLNTPTWIHGLCGIHPKFGFFNTNMFDNFQTRAKIRVISTTQPYGHLAIEDTFNKLITNTGSLVQIVALTIEPPSSFNLYTTNIPLQFQGYSYILPAQNINLIDEFSDPYNKIFYCYIKRNGQDIIMDIDEYLQNESTTCMYVGNIVTTSTNISEVNINKRTRINLYGLSSFDDLYGNSIQYNKNLTPNISIDDEVKYALMFNDNESVFYRQLFSPPTSSTILSTWFRTDGQNYYTDPTTIPSGSDAAQWFIDVDGSFVQPNNTNNLNTLLSPELLDRYEFETILTSPNADDDYIGLVVSSGYVAGEYISLLAGIHTKGFTSPKFSINLYRNGVNLFSGGGVLVGDNTLTDLAGWSNNTMKLKVVRDRNIITVTRGDDWNSTSYSNSAILTFDIFTLDPSLHFLAEKQRYGFATMSQAGSRYLNYSIKQSVSYDSSIVYNRTGEKYEYNTTTNAWDYKGNSAASDLGYPRKVINPLTKQIMKFEIGGNSVVLQDSAIIYNTPNSEHTITISNNTLLDIPKVDIESEYSSSYGSVEYMQVVYSSPNLTVNDSGSVLSIQSTTGNGEIYVYFRAGAVLSFKRIIIDVQ